MCTTYVSFADVLDLYPTIRDDPFTINEDQYAEKDEYRFSKHFKVKPVQTVLGEDPILIPLVAEVQPDGSLIFPTNYEELRAIVFETLRTKHFFGSQWKFSFDNDWWYQQHVKHCDEWLRLRDLDWTVDFVLLWMDSWTLVMNISGAFITTPALGPIMQGLEVGLSVMWFIKNGHPAKSNYSESEVFNERETKASTLF